MAPSKPDDRILPPRRRPRADARLRPLRRADPHLGIDVRAVQPPGPQGAGGVAGARHRHRRRRGRRRRHGRGRPARDRERRTVLGLGRVDGGRPGRREGLDQCPQCRDERGNDDVPDRRRGRGWHQPRRRVRTEPAGARRRVRDVRRRDRDAGDQPREARRGLRRGVTAPDAAFARELAEAAGRILLQRYERVEIIDHKSARDVVTEVDHLSEAMILDAIRARFPGDGILAEESGAHHGTASGAASRSRRPTRGGGDAPEAEGRSLAHGRTWVVDPLDGTINYANGIPYFCVSIGLVVDGVPMAGAVHDPMRAETFWASADGPAMLGEVEIHASRKDQLSDFVVSMALGGSSVTSRARAVRKVVRATRNTGSSALALAYVANGRFDAFLQTGAMSAWDVAAAGLIAERAGALVTDAAGAGWFDVSGITRGFGIVAAPPAHHEELLRRSREAPGPGSAPAPGEAQLMSAAEVDRIAAAAED